MPRQKKQVSQPEQTEAPQIESVNTTSQPLSATREDYLRARAVIQLYRENQKSRPKRKCSQRQLEALAQGRARNPRTKKKEANQESQ